MAPTSVAFTHLMHAVVVVVAAAVAAAAVAAAAVAAAVVHGSRRCFNCRELSHQCETAINE